MDRRGQRRATDASGRSAARALGAILGSRDGRMLAITLVSLAGVGLAAVLAFVVPNLADYRVLQLADVGDAQAELHGQGRSWIASGGSRSSTTSSRGCGSRSSWPWSAALGMLVRWRDRVPANACCWPGSSLGIAELLVHDVGNERRLVFLIPALIGVAALALGRDGRLLPDVARRLLTPPGCLGACRSSSTRPTCWSARSRASSFLYQIGPSVRSRPASPWSPWSCSDDLAAAARLLSARRVGLRAALALAGLLCAGDLAQFGQWAAGRTYKNYGAMRMVAERIPPGTVVQGKLANGLALESRIRADLRGQELRQLRRPLRRATMPGSS